MKMKRVSAAPASRAVASLIIPALEVLVALEDEEVVVAGSVDLAKVCVIDSNNIKAAKKLLIG